MNVSNCVLGAVILFCSHLSDCASSHISNQPNDKSSYYASVIWYVKGSNDVRKTARKQIGPIPKIDKLNIIISDSVSYFPYEYFNDMIVGEKIGNKIIDEKMINEIDLVRNNTETNENYYENKKSEISLFMSPPYENTLIAEVIIDRDHIGNYKLLIQTTTEAIRYLFIFDEYGDIVEVFKSGVLYN